LTRDGVLVITAQSHRTQERNRADALERLTELIRQAAVRPVPRRPTRPPKASRRRRVDDKKRRGSIKALRGTKAPMD
jgi:ribosome-associated protein